MHNGCYCGILGGAVLDGTTTQVDDQTMGMEEICPDDGLLHVSHDKSPCECAPQVQTDRDRPSTVQYVAISLPLAARTRRLYCGVRRRSWLLAGRTLTVAPVSIKIGRGW